MAWTDSRVFTQAVLNPLTQSAQGRSNAALTTGMSSTGGILTDTINVALFGSGVTPDRNAAVASTGYNTGTWTTGNESSGTGYSAGGSALASKTYASGTSTVAF